MAAATPIHDIEGGSPAFDGTGCLRGSGNFYGETASGGDVCLPGQSGVHKRYPKGAVSAFEIEGNDLEPQYPIRADLLEAGREVTNPAPATLFLLGTGLIGLAAFRRKRLVAPRNKNSQR